MDNSLTTKSIAAQARAQGVSDVFFGVKNDPLHWMAFGETVRAAYEAGRDSANARFGIARAPNSPQHTNHYPLIGSSTDNPISGFSAHH